MKFFGASESSVKYTEDDLETYLGLNVKMLSAMSIFVGLNGKKDFREFGVFSKIPFLTILTVIFSLSSGLNQCFLISLIISTDVKTATYLFTYIFINFCCVTKGIRLSTTKKDLQNLLDDVSKMWNENRPKGQCRTNVIKRAKSTLTFVKGYTCTLIGLLVNLGSPPLRSMLSQYLSQRSSNYSYDYSVRVFIIKYPFKIDSAKVYYTVLCEEYWVMFGLALCWISCDTLFASLTTHLSIQLEILEDDIKYLFDYETDEEILERNVYIFVNRHRQILSACKEVERIFSPIVFLNVIVSSIIICLNTFMWQEAAAAKAYGDAFYHFFMLFNTFLQIIVYCVFAETLTQKTISISNEIYNCEWLDKSHKFKICIQILLTRTQSPFYYTAYGFFALTHQQFSKILNTALSYYMMLRATSK